MLRGAVIFIPVGFLVTVCGNTGRTFAQEEASPTSLQEYCHLETFRPRCRHGNVIVMETARFGRMSIGRCIVQDAYLAAFQQVDPSIVGCSADVLDYLDRVCSGRSSCDISVASPELHRYRPCSAQLEKHLEASYFCIDVVEGDRSCSISVTVGSRLHISSSPRNQRADSARCGSQQHPWMLEAQTGQQINVSLLDFTGQRQDVDRPSTTGRVDCVVQYGYIVDKTQNNNNVSICRNVHRHQLLYQSKGNKLEIVLWNSETKDDQPNYMLAVEAVGCSNIVPPADAWLRRADNEATIGCYMTRQRWNLRCDGNQWKGTIGVCTQFEQHMDDHSDRQVVAVHSDDTTDSYFIQVLAIVATSFVGLAICLIIIFVGICCARRYQLQQRTSSVDGRSLLIGYNDEIKRDHLTTDRPRNTVQVVDRQQIYADQQVNGPQSNHPVPQYFVLDKDAVINDSRVSTLPR